jgi:hypothetical protein
MLSKGAFGHSMVPIPGIVADQPEGAGEYQRDELMRSRRGWRKWMPQVDDQGWLIVEYGFVVTSDPWRIELIGRAVMWLQEQGRLT